jgi:hypothetical protein
MKRTHVSLIEYALLFALIALVLWFWNRPQSEAPPIITPTEQR